MAIQVVPKSRLNFGKNRILEEIEHFDLLELPEIPVQADDTAYEVLSSDRITTLAYKFYDSAVLWWVIAAANGLELLPVDMYPGLILRIPSKRYVFQVLLNTNVGNRRRGATDNG